MPHQGWRSAPSLMIQRLIVGWMSARLDGATLRPRRRSVRVCVGGNQLETRTMLSVSAVKGSAGTVSTTPGSLPATFNLQLQPGSAEAFSQLMPLIAADGATVMPTTVTGLYTVQGPPPRTRRGLPRIFRATRRSSTPSRCRRSRIQTVPNDPDYVNGNQWQLNGTWGVNAPRPGTSRPAPIR